MKSAILCFYSYKNPTPLVVCFPYVLLLYTYDLFRSVGVVLFFVFFFCGVHCNFPADGIISSQPAGEVDKGVRCSRLERVLTPQNVPDEVLSLPKKNTMTFVVVRTFFLQIVQKRAKLRSGRGLAWTRLGWS